MNHNKLSDHSLDSSETPWDTLASQSESPLTSQDEPIPEPQDKIISDYHAEQVREAPERAHFFAKNIGDAEIAFGSQLDRVSSHGEAHISAEEYELWENDLMGDWARLQEQVSLGRLSSSEEAAAEAPIFIAAAPKDTIEAHAGHFFDDRKNALLRAIRASDSATAESDIQSIREFPSLVAIHLDYRYMSQREAAEHYGNAYDHSRTEAHNNVIDRLNHLNSLAHKYHTRPFTPRNFWNSRNSRHGDSADIKNRMSHDRHIVEEYCTYAFSDDITYRERKQKRENP